MFFVTNFFTNNSPFLNWNNFFTFFSDFHSKLHFLLFLWLCAHGAGCLRDAHGAGWLSDWHSWFPVSSLRNIYTWSELWIWLFWLNFRWKSNLLGTKLKEFLIKYTFYLKKRRITTIFSDFRFCFQFIQRRRLLSWPQQVGCSTVRAHSLVCPFSDDRLTQERFCCAFLHCCV